MMLSPDDLPDDVAALKAMLIAARAENAAIAVETRRSQPRRSTASAHSMASKSRSAAARKPSAGTHGSPDRSRSSTP